MSSTRQGYLWKRQISGGGSPPAVQRVFCVLAGTTLWDYDSEDEAALGQRPRSEVNVIGVSPWDGRARYQNYAFGFLFLSAQGTTYHAVAQSKEDLEHWLSAIRLGLQVRFGIMGSTGGADIDDEEEDEEKVDEEGEKEVNEVEGEESECSLFLQDEAQGRALEDGGDKHTITARCASASTAPRGNNKGSMNEGSMNPPSAVLTWKSPSTQSTRSVTPTSTKTNSDPSRRENWHFPASSSASSSSSSPVSSSHSSAGDLAAVIGTCPSKKDSDTCGISGQPLGRSNPKHFCLSCGGAFALEYCSDEVPLLHFKYQQAVRVCRNCLLAQYFLNHLKLLNATLRTHLHELELEGCSVADKNSAKIRVFRQSSPEVVLAWQLYEGGQIDAAEFTELLKADARLKDERQNGMLAEFQTKLAQPGVGDDAIKLLRFLFDLRDEGQPVKYALVLQRLLAIAQTDLAAVDFVLPQLLQVYVLMSDRGGVEQVLQLEALEDFLVKICCMSTAQIPLRVVWSMMGYYEDTLQPNAPASLTARRGRIIRLTLHVEAAVRGDVHCFSEEILSIFSFAAPVQLALLRREWSLVQECRQHPLLRPFPPMTAFRKMHGEIGDDPKVASLAIAETLRAYDRSYSARAREMGHHGGSRAMFSTTSAGDGRGAGKENEKEEAGLISFTTQMNFVKELTDAAESLRHIDPSLRRETLRATLQRIQNEYHGVYFPITRDFGSMPRIIRVCADEGAVFRSKARVPVLICFEVIRPTPKEASGHHQQRSGSAATYMSEQEAENLLDKSSLHERMISLGLSGNGNGSAGGGGAGADVGEMASGAAEATPTTTTTTYAQEERRRTFSLAGNAALAGGQGGLMPSSAAAAGMVIQRYASKSEVLQMVQTRRRRTGGVRADAAGSPITEVSVHSPRNGRRAAPSSSSSCSSSPLPSSSSAAAVNLAQLIQLYEQSCAWKETADRSVGGEERGNMSAGQSVEDSTAAAAINIPSAVATAIEEFKKGNLSEAELEMLVANDQRFRQNILDNSYLDVQFHVSMAFGESWATKRARIKAASPDGRRPGWDLLSMIVKSNDDLRQEECMVQLIELCQDIFVEAGLDLWLEPYGIISTTSSTGLIQTLTDALSLDALKKKDGYVSLAHHFQATYGHDAARLTQAKRSFITSLAAYSLVCYVFQIKDRHNGNILLDTEGHLAHIDYGFILGIAPGGSFSIETAPFKLTPEMVDVMGGLDGPLFDEFAALFAGGFFALQLNMERIVALVEIMAEQSRYPCFQATDKAVILQRLRARLLSGGRAPSSKVDTVAFALDLITQSYNSLTTLQYERYQNFTNGVAI